jgi:hypothetical protein
MDRQHWPAVTEFGGSTLDQIPTQEYSVCASGVEPYRLRRLEDVAQQYPKYI